VCHPPIFAKASRLDPEKLEIVKADTNVWKPPALFTVRHPLGRLHCTWCLKKTDHGNPVATIAIST
jgi:hypothetical protein